MTPHNSHPSATHLRLKWLIVIPVWLTITATIITITWLVSPTLAAISGLTIAAITWQIRIAS